MQFRNTKICAPVSKGSLTVHGTGNIEVDSDRARLNVKISSQSKSIEEAKDSNKTIYNNILDSLYDYGVSKGNIQSKDVSVTKNYDPNTNVFTSYSVTQVISIFVDDFSKLNDIYSLVIENGANDNINIDFILSNPSYYYNKALKKASQDALSKANLLAKNFGVKYNPVPYKITETSSSLYAITYTSSNTDYYMDIAPGLVKITAELDAVFSTYPL